MNNLQWTCTICNRTMQLGSMNSHLAGQPHMNMLQQTNAGQPNMNQASQSTANSQKLHPNGQRRIPVRAVAEVHGHVCEIPLEAYGPHVRRGSMVTPEDVERASDKWDAMGIAHDIDTQWGSIPHGGAYKESDFFYGDDPFDF